MTQLRADARENRERILVAAREVFAERGLDSTMTEVAQRAGVGVGTLYRRFPTREHLVVEVMGGRVDLLARRAEAALAVHDDPLGSFVGYLRQHVALLAEDRGLRDLVAAPRDGDLPVELAERYAEATSRLDDLLEQLVGRAQAAGVLRPDVSAYDLPLVTGAMLAAASLGGSLRPDLGERVLGLLLAGLVTDDAATGLDTAVPPLTREELHAVLAGPRKP